MVVPPRSQRCLKHSEHKQRSSGARRPMQRIDPRSVSPGISHNAKLGWQLLGRKAAAPITPCVKTCTSQPCAEWFPYCLLSIALVSAFGFQIDEIEKDFLRAS